MKRAALLLLGVLLLPAHADDKGTEVKFGDLKSTTPASWKPGKFGGFRFMEFKLPHHKDDEVDGDLAIFKGFGGSKKENLTRWKGQFIAPEGKSIDDVTKVEEMKVADCEVLYVDISGTYLEGPPMLPAAQKKKRPGYRMLAVQFEAPDDKYHIKLVGPAKTIEKHKKEFDEWLKGFKK